MLSLNIPKNIFINVTDTYLMVEGPLGCKWKKKTACLKIVINYSLQKLYLFHENAISIHFYLILVNKLILGVLKGFYIKMNIIGVGYKVVLINNILNLKIGLSHQIQYKIPNNIKVVILPKRLITLIIKGTDLAHVNQVAAEIRALKPIEPYKGKGIKYSKEVWKKKEGKKTHV